MGGPDAWRGSETIWRAIEVSDGEVRNPAILEFQNRSAEKPYPILAS
jgi:hypothetical protein